jgi:hypothetical protein
LGSARDHTYIRFYDDTDGFAFNVDVMTFKFERAVLNSLISVYHTGMTDGREQLKLEVSQLLNVKLFDQAG